MFFKASTSVRSSLKAELFAALFGLLIQFMGTSSAWAGLQNAVGKCSSGRSGWTGYSWCVYSDPTSTSRSVLYYFHGNGGSEKSWNSPEYAKVHNQLISLWAQNLKAPAAVISVSFGTNWFLNSSLSKILLQDLMPQTEAELSFSVQNRVLMGESMGGFNAAVMAASRSARFDRVAVLCPAIYNINPYSDSGTIAQFLQKQPADINRKFIEKWLDKQRSYFPSAAEFDAVDPARLATKIANPQLPIFLQANQKDPLGVFEAAQVLARSAQQKGLNWKWWSLPNTGHCEQSTDSVAALARFLSI